MKEIRTRTQQRNRPFGIAAAAAAALPKLKRMLSTAYNVE